MSDSDVKKLRAAPQKPASSPTPSEQESEVNARKQEEFSSQQDTPGRRVPEPFTPIWRL